MKDLPAFDGHEPVLFHSQQSTMKKKVKSTPKTSDKNCTLPFKFKLGNECVFMDYHNMMRMGFISYNLSIF